MALDKHSSAENALDKSSSAENASGESPLVFLFNGDADGIVAQHILGLEIGSPDARITGRKRDIDLLRLAPPMERGRIHVMDVSLARNRDALTALLPVMDKGGLSVTWYDHHDPGGPIAHPALTLNINQAPETCTAVIVNAVLGHKHPLWAAMGAYGDNLPATASALASAGGASSHEAALLRRVGELLNYNAYGDEPGDALFDAAEIAARMAGIPSALDFCWEQSLIAPLAARFDEDRELFHQLAPLVESASACAYLVPDEAFARRYGATWANERVMQKPLEALAVIHPRKDGTYRVSIRSPRDWRSGGAMLAKDAADGENGKDGKEAEGGEGAVRSAAELAKEFPTGGGRKLAAGIDVLPADQLQRFTDRFREFYA